jgi:hypothetical protein
MPYHLTRRQIIVGAAATAAVAAMPEPSAIAAGGLTPAQMGGWAFIVNDVTRPLLARLPIDMASDAGEQLLFELIAESAGVDMEAGPHFWIAVNIDDDDALAVAGGETWSYRAALIDAGWQMEALS